MRTSSLQTDGRCAGLQHMNRSLFSLLGHALSLTQHRDCSCRRRRRRWTRTLRRCSAYRQHGAPLLLCLVALIRLACGCASMQQCLRLRLYAAKLALPTPHGAVTGGRCTAGCGVLQSQSTTLLRIGAAPGLRWLGAAAAVVPRRLQRRRLSGE
jgi:hypothetical protein